jgi:hypothetical protein
MIYPRLNRVRNGQRLSVELVNGLIKRTEYAGDLLRQGKCLAGTNVSVAQRYDGSLVSAGLNEGNSFFIGIAAATGGATSIQTIDTFNINNKPANITQVLGTATYLGGTSYRLTNNLFNEVGAIWHEQRISLSSFSASFNYQIGGASNADGFSLIFCPSYFLAGEGGGLGYQGAPSNSVAVEIDIFKNSYDPDNSHIAVLSGGSVLTHLSLYSVTVRPSGNLAVTYSSKTLYIYHNNILIITYPIDLNSIIGQ